MRPVGIVGVAQTRHAERRDDVNYAELAFEVVSDLLARTGWSHDRIDTVITASSDFWDGRTISDMAVQDAAGAAGKSALKVSMDGTFALVYAAARIGSGAYRTCLVVAHGKASEGNPRLIANAAFDPIFQRPMGIDDHTALGLQARCFLDRRGLTSEVLAEAAARSAAAAATNPNAQRRQADPSFFQFHGFASKESVEDLRGEIAHAGVVGVDAGERGPGALAEEVVVVDADEAEVRRAHERARGAGRASRGGSGQPARGRSRDLRRPGSR